jgi:DNA-binding response OmpR family regulator
MIMALQPIVLIDDDRSWSQATADFLRTEGFEVQTAVDGERGLELLDGTVPILVILDAHMPRLGGLEVLRELRQNDVQLPVLMVSGDDRSALINQAMGAGASAFLRKPIAGGLLLRAIRRLTQAAAAGDAASHRVP